MIQIIGRNNNRDTKKAIMFFKERRLDFQFVDLDARNLSRREWLSILNGQDNIDSLIDKDSSFYKKEGYAWREYNPLEELILNPELLRIPVIRNGNKISVGYDKSSLQELL